MPIRRFHRQRIRGARPFHIFEGTLTDARRTPLKKIISAFEDSGVQFSERTHAMKTAKRLKEAVIRRMQDLKTRSASQHIFSFGLPNGVVDFRVARSPKGKMRFVVHQNPVMHGIRPLTYKIDSFGVLKIILSEGFRSERWPNVDRVYERKIPSSWASPNLPYARSIKSIRGDRYTLHIMAPMTRSGKPEQGGIEKFGPEQILGIVIEHPKVSKAVMSRKKKFYKRNFQNIPFKLVERE